MDPPEISSLVEDLRRTSGSPEGKARFAVLEAVRHAVKDRGIPNTPSSYAAALTSAAVTSMSSDGDGEEMLAAIVYLLGHILSSISDKILRAKFVPMIDAVGAAMDRGVNNAGISRHGVQCLFILLKAQEDVAWFAPQAAESFQRLLTYSVDPRPKIRKAAHGYVLILVQNLTHTPRALMENMILSFCNSVFRSSTSADTVRTQHLLGLLKDVMPLLSSKTIGNLVAPTLQLLDLGDRALFVQVLNSIESITATETCDISGKTLTSAVSTIISKQPMHQKGASESVKAYLSCLGSALRKLHATAPAEVDSRLAEVFSRVADFFLPADGDDSAVAAANLLCDLIDVAVQPPLIRAALQVARPPLCVSTQRSRPDCRACAGRGARLGGGAGGGGRGGAAAVAVQGELALHPARRAEPLQPAAGRLAPADAGAAQAPRRHHHARQERRRPRAGGARRGAGGGHREHGPGAPAGGVPPLRGRGRAVAGPPQQHVAPPPAQEARARRPPRLLHADPAAAGGPAARGGGGGGGRREARGGQEPHGPPRAGCAAPASFPPAASAATPPPPCAPSPAL